MVQREPPAASRESKDQRGGLHSDGIVNKSHQETTANPEEHGPDCLIHLLQKGLTPQQLHRHAPNKSGTHFESPRGSGAAGGWSAASSKSRCSDNIPLLADTRTLPKGSGGAHGAAPDQQESLSTSDSKITNNNDRIHKVRVSATTTT